ncbi:MAG: TetR/AcrR family transcriptional regulator [Rhizobiaceae bacterium]|nr:TetR/AcrR family transcriptional regulator [Rhizobiaceae bacterium]MCV0409092.1 TetR/AcrR family transcriptional regulator [Rhizobiaceae bacterium]
MPKPIAEYRKPEIVEGVLKAINKHGLPLPSYDTIAQEAGMSRQLIRHYFPDPEKLMLAVCDALAASYRELLMKGILQAQATERLPLFLDFYFNFLADKGLRKPADDAVYDAMFSLAVASPAIRQNLHDQYDLLRHTIAHEVQISNPGLPQAACREIGFLFVALMYGHWKMVATLGFSQEHNRVTREALDRLLQSYNQRYDDPDQ